MLEELVKCLQIDLEETALQKKTYSCPGINSLELTYDVTADQENYVFLNTLHFKSNCVSKCYQYQIMKPVRQGPQPQFTG